MLFALTASSSPQVLFALTARVQTEMLRGAMNRGLTWDDARDFARRSVLHEEVEIVHPPERCKKRVGRGRCRRAVSRGCIIQICASHMKTAVSDENLDSLRQFHTLVPEGNDPRWRQIGMRERSRPPAPVQMMNDSVSCQRQWREHRTRNISLL